VSSLLYFAFCTEPVPVSCFPVSVLFTRFQITDYLCGFPRERGLTQGQALRNLPAAKHQLVECFFRYLQQLLKPEARFSAIAQM
jgi:hypothetical protein